MSSLIGLLIGLFVLAVILCILRILVKIFQHDLHLLVHFLHLTDFLFAKIHESVFDIHLRLLLLLLLRLLLLVETIQLGNPFLGLSLLAVSYEALDYTVIRRLAAS
jgi:hypothetical protein